MEEKKEQCKQSVIDRVEDNAFQIDEMIQRIIQPYSAELDDYVEIVNNVLIDSENPPTDDELDSFALNLSTLIYYASVGCEQMGIRDDLSKSIYKEAYNNARNLMTTGTVADKNAQAEVEAREEQIASIVYNKSFKILKAKVESAQEILGSVKKILTRRISEYEVTRVGRQ